MKKLIFSAFILSFFKISSQSYTAGTQYPGYVNITDTLLNYKTSPFTQETYSIDVFGSVATDIEFMARGSVSSGGSQAFIRVTSLNPNVYISLGRIDSVFVPASSNYNVTNIAKPLNAGNVINSAGAVWDNTTLYLTDHSGSGGGNKNVNDFVGGDKYIGLKFVSPGANSYGWIRVSCISQDSCTLKTT
ncbi:MAG: hypothetical protein JWO32_253 [Bacteroidetes bacterium]|nr:hypothetical protein [Bacteroidota bacterium]